MSPCCLTIMMMGSGTIVSIGSGIEVKTPSFMELILEVGWWYFIQFGISFKPLMIFILADANLPLEYIYANLSNFVSTLHSNLWIVFPRAPKTPASHAHRSTEWGNGIEYLNKVWAFVNRLNFR